MNIMRILFFGLVTFFSVYSYAQNNINNYKYVMVPEGYTFLSENDRYQLNSLTKFLFEKYGFKAFIRGTEYPDDMKNNGCLGLMADVKKNSGLFLTKLFVELKNCNGNVVFTSKVGTSREKEFKRAYQEALRDAFQSIKNLNYKYVKVDQEQPENVAVVNAVPIASKNEILVNEKSDQKEISQKDSNSDKTSVENKIVLYTLNDQAFGLKKQDYGFEFFKIEDDKTVLLGKMLKSTGNKSYVIKAGDYSGNGYFDAYGNFILERVNPMTNKLITDTLARQ